MLLISIIVRFHSPLITWWCGLFAFGAHFTIITVCIFGRAAALTDDRRNISYFFSLSSSQFRHSHRIFFPLVIALCAHMFQRNFSCFPLSTYIMSCSLSSLPVTNVSFFFLSLSFSINLLLFFLSRKCSLKDNCIWISMVRFSFVVVVILTAATAAAACLLVVVGWLVGTTAWYYFINTNYILKAIEQ